MCKHELEQGLLVPFSNLSTYHVFTSQLCAVWRTDRIHSEGEQMLWERLQSC